MSLQSETAITNIPHFLSASTPEQLRRLMLRNNVKNSMIFKYFDIQFVNGKWYAWFFLDISKTWLTREVL